MIQIMTGNPAPSVGVKGLDQNSDVFCRAGDTIFPALVNQLDSALAFRWYQSCGQALAAESKIGIKKQTRAIDPEQVLIPDNQEK